MKGRYAASLIKDILHYHLVLGKTQEETAKLLGISTKTVSRHVIQAKKAGFVLEDLELSAMELVKKIQPRFADNHLRQRITLKKYMTKKHLAESAKRYSKSMCFADCYRVYLTEKMDKPHFGIDYYKILLRRFMKKQIENSGFFDIHWTFDDVREMASYVGPAFLGFIESILTRGVKGNKEHARKNLYSCMRLISLIHGNKALYAEAESLALKKMKLVVFWKVLTEIKDSVMSASSKWDARFFTYVEKRKEQYQQVELKRLRLI